MNELRCSECSEKCYRLAKPPEGERFGSACDSCASVFCETCSEISPSEIRAVVLKQRVLLFYCPACSASITEIPKLKDELKLLQAEVQKYSKK